MIYTKEDTATGIVAVWAIPRSKWASDDKPPFTYELHTRNPYESGAVKVVEHEVTLRVPAGENLVAKAVSTLEEEKNDALKAYLATVEELNLRISQLKLLTGAPADDGALEGFSEVLENP